MSRIYSSNGNVIPVNLPTVQQQTNSIDCGVFAIAYATEFCFNQYTGGKGLTFNTSVKRDHLLQCLSNKQLQPFPKVQPKNTLKLHKNTSVYISEDDAQETGASLLDVHTAKISIKIFQY